MHNGILEPKEFEKWCNKNYNKVISWFDTVESYVEGRLAEDNYISVETVTSKSFISKMLGFGKTTKKVGSAMRDEAIKLQGLKKFFLDFSAIAEREVFEVSLWEDYLIFAHLLGVANKIEEQLRKVYPDFSQYSQIDTGVSVAADIALKGYLAACSGWSSAHSGSGGRSSSGGGGGSRGGSSGGGFR